jgi:hypothetical protein
MVSSALSSIPQEATAAREQVGHPPGWRVQRCARPPPEAKSDQRADSVPQVLQDAMCHGISMGWVTSIEGRGTMARSKHSGTPAAWKEALGEDGDWLRLVGPQAVADRSRGVRSESPNGPAR